MEGYQQVHVTQDMTDLEIVQRGPGSLNNKGCPGTATHWLCIALHFVTQAKQSQLLQHINGWHTACDLTIFPDHNEVQRQDTVTCIQHAT